VVERRELVVCVMGEILEDGVDLCMRKFKEMYATKDEQQGGGTAKNGEGHCEE